MPRIARIQAWAFRSPVATPVATSFGVMRDRPAVFLRIEDADGAFGWGEIFANWPAAGAEHRVNLMADDVAPLLEGRDADSPPDLSADLEAQTDIRALQCGEFGPFRQVLAGIDLALWDLVARRAAVPLHVAMGALPVTRVPAYASGIHVVAAEKAIPDARANGFHTFKVKVGFDWRRDAALVRDLCKGLDAGETLCVDANQAWCVEEALRFLDRIADLPLGWLEEPIRADRPLADWRELAGRVPLAGGENIAGLDRFDVAIEAGVLDILQPDVAKWGGITGCLHVARAALAAGRTYCPHFLGGGIGLSASAHLLAAAGGPGLLEVDVNPNPLRDAFGMAAERIRDGFWTVGDTPGNGPEDLPPDVRACVTHHREIRV